MVEKIKLGLLGGTFDPIHNGHLAIAGTVLQKVGLSRILFIPAGRPWQKEGRHIAAAEHRIHMIERAIRSNPRFELSAIEIERPEVTYTVDTLTELIRDIKGTELYIIMGWDTLQDFPRWKDPERMLRLCNLVVVPRPGFPRPEIDNLERDLPGLPDRLLMLDGPEIDISSSGIRERIANGIPFEHLVPGTVAQYIKEHGLYTWAQ